ncbi:MAG: hypothetical protein NZM65_04285 [Flavobacteriales bacterium]|nr:hypothetical protein [Flavobacteriales bacterium]MDW8409888.1 hypothetical protein [Flavobacteriales bacterium]
MRSGIHWEMGGVRIVDSMMIFHKMEERTLGAALQFYCGEEQRQPHRALADAEAAGRVLEAQLKKYPHLLCEVDFLAEFSTVILPPDWEGKLEWGLDGEAYFRFGKHKGKSVRAAFLEEPSYYYWMMKKDFLLSTKEFITRIFYSLYSHKKPVP